MSASEDCQMIEYEALMNHSAHVERTSQLCWTACGMAAAVLLSWGISGTNPALMIPVLLVIAFGFYARLRGRQQVRLIAGYVEEFHESRNGGPQWFTRLAQFQMTPTFHPAGDWLTVALANATVMAAVALSWLYSGSGERGELMAGFMTGCAVVFAFHSMSETTKLRQGRMAQMWRQASADLRDMRATRRSVA
jgi:hypothetical protein